VVVEDCGRVINPMIVEGQVQGGTAQGIGSALLEELVYDEAGQLLTSTFADYLLPSMTDVPPIEVLHVETLSPLTPLGNKGMGEAGAIGPMAAIGNAVSDALGRSVTEVPLTPRRVWELANSPGE
jgi:carbon-monoxide dehydrogenase large subunit